MDERRNPADWGLMARAGSPGDSPRDALGEHRRILIEDVYPELDCGRFAVKREVGERFEVWADILMDGHDLLQAVVRYAAADDGQWREAPMALFENDRW